MDWPVPRESLRPHAKSSAHNTYSGPSGIHAMCSVHLKAVGVSTECSVDHIAAGMGAMSDVYSGVARMGITGVQFG